jgi:hypothetical protein
LFRDGSKYDEDLRGKSFTRTDAVEKHIAKIVQLRKKQALVFEGKTAHEWAEFYSVHQSSIHGHLRRYGHLDYVGRKSGWAKPKPPAETIDKKKLRVSKLGKSNSKKCHTPDGIFDSATDAAKFYGVDKTAICYRIKNTKEKFADWYYIEETA